MTKIRTAVFPVAGMGTRFLPATKSVPKEMLPLLDRPLIQYAMDEARAAGIERFVFVTAPEKTALESYFCRANTLEERLTKAGKTAALKALEPSNISDASMTFIRQDQPKGLGHAVWLARHAVGDQPFAVLLPDDVIRAPRPALAQMIEARARTGGHMVATMDVAPERTGSYGILKPGASFGRVTQTSGLVEKPAPQNAPSTKAVVGRYILDPSIFDRLETLDPGAGGEIQLTDAISAEAQNSGVFGYDFIGERFDCGSVEGYTEASIVFAMDRPELAGMIRRTLARSVCDNPQAA